MNVTMGLCAWVMCEQLSAMKKKTDFRSLLSSNTMTQKSGSGNAGGASGQSKALALTSAPTLGGKPMG